MASTQGRWWKGAILTPEAVGGGVEEFVGAPVAIAVGAISGFCTQLLTNPGDLIEVSRGTFQHWAVYIGDGFVVHLVPPSGYLGACGSGSTCSVMSAFPGMAVVKKERIEVVVGTGSWKINNYLDKKVTPRSPMVIVWEAKRRVGIVVAYSPGNYNCEHFATDMRYGKPCSRQGKWWKGAVLTAGVVVAGVVACVGAPVTIGGATAALSGFAFVRRFW